jgi:DNA polymerase-3 subunit delta
VRLLLLDCDEYLVANRVAELKAALGDPEFAALNITEFGESGVGAGDILAQAEMMPFLAPRRLILVRGYLGRLDTRMAQSKETSSAAHVEAAKLLTGLTELGDGADLVFIDSKVDKRRQLWKGFKDGTGRSVPGLQTLVEQGRLVLEELKPPDARELSSWLQRHARAQGIVLEGRAAQLLANYVGVNLRQLDNELAKLATYAAGRPITAADVELLVSDASESMIWDLTDALTRRDGRSAMRALQILRRNDANAFYLLTMITRQYRLILKVKEAMRLYGGNEFEIAKQIGENAFPVKKAMSQAPAYTPHDLEDVLDRCLTLDYAAKSGADADTELDLLVAELTRRK